MTLTELAESYVIAEKALIGEYSGCIMRDHLRLRNRVMNEINPLLVAHGAEPLNVDKLFSEYDNYEEEE